MFEIVVVCCDKCRRPLVPLEWERGYVSAGWATPSFRGVAAPLPDGGGLVRSRNRWSRKVRDMGGGRLRLECKGRRCRFTKDAPQRWLDAAFHLAQETGRGKVYCAEVDQALEAVA